MPDDREKLRATLNDLRLQLEQSSLEPDVAEPLRQAIADIDAALAGQRKPVAVQPLTKRLSEATLEFEASHPTLAGAVGSVIDALGRMGI